MRLIAVLVSLASGCRGACEPPPATGGTAAQRAVVDAEAARFTEALRLDQCVAGVRLRDLEPGLQGGHNPRRRLVNLDLALQDPADLRDVLRHEFCHAAQIQSAPDALAAAVWRAGVSAEVPPIETFANACEIGPVTAHLLGGSCPSDAPHPEVAPAITALFHPPARVTTADLVWEPVGSLTIEGAFDVVALAHDRLLISTRAAAPVVDLWTGEPALAAAALPLGSEPDILGPDDVPGRVVSWAVQPDGDALAVLHVEEAGDLKMERQVHLSAAGFAGLGCLRRGEVVFTAAGSLWSAWRDGTDVRWGRWVTNELPAD